ncbi:hypothetical protein LDENG_00061730 [Lucifuga dentata]|nr:hypothetical protein LDENG_00061730 [Lucifuga dentata]
MGQLFSSEEELSQAKEAIGSLLHNAMLEGGAIPDLGVIHPLLLPNQNESLDSRTRLQVQLQQLQGDIGNRAPTYLRDLIGRLSSFSEEPRLAGLVGLVVTMVMDMVCTSSKRSSDVTGKPAGSSSSQQRVWELQEVMEEYLKRCRINLGDKSRLIQDSIRLEAQLSFTLTQLKTCLLEGDCDSRSLKQWASGAAFHTQMLVHLAGLDGQAEPLAARAALDQYKEDFMQIIPAYSLLTGSAALQLQQRIKHTDRTMEATRTGPGRLPCYKTKTVCVVKCRGSLLESHDPSSEVAEEGDVTGLTVTDRETGRSVTVSRSAVERETGRRRRSVSGPDSTSAPAYSSINLDLITSDQFAQAYLDHLFSDQGPVAELQDYFTKARDDLSRFITEAAAKKQTEGSDEGHRKGQAEGGSGGKRDQTGRQEETEGCERGDESLKLSIVETQPDETY